MSTGKRVSMNCSVSSNARADSLTVRGTEVPNTARHFLLADALPSASIASIASIASRQRL